MPRTGENIYKRKDGRWEGRYIIGHIGGKVKYGYVYSRTYGETKKKLQNVNTAKKLTVKRNIAEYRFGDYAEEWLTALMPQIKESTAVKYENILRLYVLPYFSNVSVSDITNDDIKDFANEMLSCGGRKNNGLSAKTVSGILSVMKNILKFVLEKGITVNADTSSVILKHTQKNMRILDVSEHKKLNKWLCDNISLSNMGILLSLYTGIRVGELCALKWGDISIESKSLAINKTMQRIKSNDGAHKTKVIVTVPKSDCSIRTIPIPDCISDMLSEVKCSDDTYFLTGRADRYIEPRTMQNRFKAILKKCGIHIISYSERQWRPDK